MKKIAVTFVCQKGNIATESLGLMASIKEHLRGDYDVFIAIPNKKWIEPNNKVLNFLKKLGAKIIVINNTENNLYLNKAFALKHVAQEGDYSKIIFLDSDRVFFKECNINTLRTSKHQLSGILAWHPSDRACFHNRYEKLFGTCKVKMPKLAEDGTPHMFNSSIIIVNIEDIPHLINAWIDMFHIFIDTGILNNGKRKCSYAHHEQTAYSMAVHKLNLNYEIELVNMIRKTCTHYSYIGSIEDQPNTRKGLLTVMNKYPYIRENFKKYPIYNTLFK